MSVLSSLQAYTDPNGLVCPTSNPATDSTNNGLLYTAEAIIALSDNGELTPAVCEQFSKIYQSCEVVPGLMKRLPDGTGGQEGPDDYYGCGAASVLCSSGLAGNILAYGQKRSSPHSTLSGSFWSHLGYHILRLWYWRGVPQCYNNEDPGKFDWSSWLGRFPQLTMHLKLSSNKTPNIIERIWWSCSLLVSSFASSNNAGAWALSWLQVRVWELKKNGFMEKLVVKFWRWKFNKNWSNPGQMMSAYFNNPHHPLAVWLQNSK